MKRVLWALVAGTILSGAAAMYAAANAQVVDSGVAPMDAAEERVAS